ncbi:hypothetical protein AHAS_Ahas02G0131300 [Arachis hypogaea]
MAVALLAAAVAIELEERRCRDVIEPLLPLPCSCSVRAHVLSYPLLLPSLKLAISATPLFWSYFTSYFDLLRRSRALPLPYSPKNMSELTNLPTTSPLPLFCSEFFSPLIYTASTLSLTPFCFSCFNFVSASFLLQLLRFCPSRSCCSLLLTLLFLALFPIPTSFDKLRYFLAEIEGPEQKSDSETKKDCRCCWILTSLHSKRIFWSYRSPIGALSTALESRYPGLSSNI